MPGQGAGWLGQGAGTMDARSDSKAIPFAVDLDGTLIATDLLWEGLFLLIRKYPLCLFMVPIWMLQGPARLKQEIAARININPALLPYRRHRARGVASMFSAVSSTGSQRRSLCPRN